jgi:phage-related protein
MISFGFEIDKASESKVNKTIDALRTSTSSALDAVGIKFETDKASEQDVLNSVNAIKESTESIQNAIGVEFTADTASEQEVVDSINRIKSDAEKLADNAASFSVDGASEQTVIEAINRIKAEAENLAENIAGFDLDEASEGRVSAAIEQLKAQAAGLAENVVGYAVDAPSVQASSDSIAGLREEALPLEANRVGYEVDKASEKGVLSSMKNLKSAATKILKGIGVGVSLVAITRSVVGMAKEFIANNEEIQGAVSSVKDQWNSWKKQIDETYGISKKLTQLIVRGINQAVKVVRRATDGFLQFSSKIGGVTKILKLLAISASAFVTALAVQKIIAIVKVLKSMDKALLQAKLKMLAIAAVIIIVALLIEDLIKFMQGNDSLIGSLLEKFGIDGEEVRDTIRGILDAVKGLLPFILNLGKQLGGFLLDTLKELLPFLIDIAKIWIPYVIGVTKELGSFLTGLGKTVIPFLIDAVKDVIGLAVRIIKDVLPVAIGLLKKLLPVILQVTKQVLPVIIGLIGKLLPMVMKIINTVLPIVTSLIETLVSVVMPIIDLILPILMALLEALMPIITFVAELLGNVLGAAFEGLMPIINAVMGIFKGLIDFIAGVFTGNWSKAWSGIVDIFRNIIGGIAEVFKFPINLIITGINTFLGGLNKLKIPDWVPGVGGKGISIPLIPQLATGSDSAPDTFIAGEQGPELITNAQGSKVFTASETIDIFQKLRDLANFAFTPKQETASNEDKPILSMFGGIAQAIKDIAALGVMPRPETVAAATSTVENKYITQNVEITNQFNGDRAGQQRSAEAMDKAADDATGILARGLVYAR